MRVCFAKRVPCWRIIDRDGQGSGDGQVISIPAAVFVQMTVQQGSIPLERVLERIAVSYILLSNGNTTEKFV
jgi:hypothetical protein